MKYADMKPGDLFTEGEGRRKERFAWFVTEVVQEESTTMITFLKCWDYFSARERVIRRRYDNSLEMCWHFTVIRSP